MWTEKVIPLQSFLCEASQGMCWAGRGSLEGEESGKGEAVVCQEVEGCRNEESDIVKINTLIYIYTVQSQTLYHEILRNLYSRHNHTVNNQWLFKNRWKNGKYCIFTKRFIGILHRIFKDSSQKVNGLRFLTIITREQQKQPNPTQPRLVGKRTGEKIVGPFAHHVHTENWKCEASPSVQEKAKHIPLPPLP